MESVFDPTEFAHLKTRIATLTPESPRQWGRMTVSQMLRHCSIGIGTATGELNPPRMLLGRLIGRVVKPLALKPNEPMRRNSPTAPCLIITGDPDFEAERQQLLTRLTAFAAAGPTACTTHPHMFFGPLTPAEWDALMHNTWTTISASSTPDTCRLNGKG